MNQKEFDLKPMRIGDVLDYTISVFRDNFKALAMITVMLYLPWVFISSLGTGTILGGLFSSMSQYFVDTFQGKDVNYLDSMDLYGFTQNFYAATIFNNLLGWLGYAYSATIKLVFHASIMKIAFDYITKNGKKYNTFQDAKFVIKESFGRLGDMLGNAALYTVITFGAIIAGALIFGIFAVVLTFVIGQSMDTITSIIYVSIIVISVLAYLFGVSVIMSRIIFGANIVVNEKKSVSESFSRSNSLSKGSYWYILGCAVFMILLYNVMGNIMGALPFLGFKIGALVTLLYVLVQVASAFIYPFIIVFLTVLYVDLRVKKEGFDLEIRFDKLIDQENKKLSGEEWNV